MEERVASPHSGDGTNILAFQPKLSKKKIVVSHEIEPGNE
jgi:hypothetical protein